MEDASAAGSDRGPTSECEAVADTSTGTGQQRADERQSRYPDYLMPYVEAGAQPLDLRFIQDREDFLVNYGYQTARAYRCDLDDIYWWATRRDYDIYALSDKQLTQYKALLRRRKYSENTIRRRMETCGRFTRCMNELKNPTERM